MDEQQNIDEYIMMSQPCSILQLLNTREREMEVFMEMEMMMKTVPDAWWW